MYWQFREKLADPVVIRRYGPDRKAMEKRTGETWDKIVEPRDKEIEEVARMVGDLKDRQHQIFININNHYEVLHLGRSEA